MKASALIPFLFSLLLLAGCDEKSHDMPAPPADTRRIVDVTVMRSSPEGLHTFDGDGVRDEGRSQCPTAAGVMSSGFFRLFLVHQLVHGC